MCVLLRRGDDTRETDEESLEEDYRATRKARAKAQREEQRVSRYQEPVEVQIGRSSDAKHDNFVDYKSRYLNNDLGLWLLT